MARKTKKTKKSKLIIKAEEFETKNRLISSKSLRIERANKKQTVSIREVKNVYAMLLEKGIREEDVYVQVMVHKVLTLKSMNETDFKDWDLDEYYENKVNWVGPKLKKFAWARICVMSSGINLMQEDED